MNALLIGRDKANILQFLPDRFLIIDDGSLIDQIELPTRRAVTIFDPAHHSFNPLKDMNYRKGRDFLDVLNAAFPEGANTLTKRYSNFHILSALLAQPKSLATLVRDTKDTQDAYQKIQMLLLSPVLNRVLNNPTNMSFTGTLLVRLNRALLGDFDCFVLANLLVSQYKGTVVIPDFGFYQCPFHVSLLRQDRLIAGINSFEEVPAFKHHFLLFDRKVGEHCTPEDAELLARYEGLMPGTNGHHDFVQRLIQSPDHSRERRADS